MRSEHQVQPFSPWQSSPPASTPGPCWARWPAVPGGLPAISPLRRLDHLGLQPVPPSLALSRSTSLVSSQTLTFSHNDPTLHPQRSLHSTTKHAATGGETIFSGVVCAQVAGALAAVCCRQVCTSSRVDHRTAATVPTSARPALPVVEQGPAILIPKVGWLF